MDNKDQRLHDLDLRQVERIRKLSLRLGRDLTLLDRHTALIAMQESRADFREMGVQDPDTDGEERMTPAALIGRLQTDQARVLQALKKAVWDTGRVLIGDSKAWKALVQGPADATDEDGE